MISSHFDILTGPNKNSCRLQNYFSTNNNTYTCYIHNTHVTRVKNHCFVANMYICLNDEGVI